jgi:hypothetical protein
MSVGDFFKTIGKVAFPFISTAAAAGGPFGVMAAQAVGRALHIDKMDSDPGSIASAMAAAMGDPAQRQALVEEEHKFQLDMAALQIKDVETLEQIAANDRRDARLREVSLKDITTRILAYLIIGAFIGMCYAMLFGTMRAESALAGAIIGYLSAKAEQVVAYYFGSSAGSDRKTELLAQSPAIGSEQGK